MSKSPPKVSVVMSVYNGERYLSEAVESILSQTFRDFEFIIIDDGSTDSSWAILTKYADQDQRVRLFKNEENLGLTKSLNKGLKLAQGEYIARQDADDISFRDRFEKQVKYLDGHPNTVLVSGEWEMIDSQGTSLGKTSRTTESALVAWYLLFFNYIGGHSQVMYRREPVMHLGGYAEDFRYSQDYNLWSRLVQLGDFYILPDVLIKYRCGHDESISVQSRAKQQNYSLITSKQSISQLIGEEFSLTEAGQLRAFWMVGLRDRLPEIHRFDFLNTNLKKIYRGFIQQSSQQDLLDSKNEINRQLRFLICQQFIYWIGWLEGKSLSKLIIFCCAFNWDSRQILSLGLSKLRKTLFNLHIKK